MGFIVLFDITSKDSLDRVKDCLRDIEFYAADNAVKVIVGNKSDLDSERADEAAAVKELADSIGVPYFEVSAKTGFGVEDLFYKVLKMILHVPGLLKRRGESNSDNTVNINPPTQATHKRPCVI